MVRVRHCCEPKTIFKLNQKHKLSEVQQGKILGTQFKYLVNMPEKTHISENLLHELVCRWDDRRMAFRVQDKVVSFTPLDVCFALGLRIVGEEVSLDSMKSEESGLSKMFEGQSITISSIVTKLEKFSGNEHPDDFWRLYILLGFAEFFIPNTSGSVDGNLLSYIDKLDSINKYSWGLVIYRILVRSVGRAQQCLLKKSKSNTVHITGCAAVLQMWAMEHMSFNHTVVSSFPRFTSWPDVSVQKEQMSELFENCLIYDELTASTEELGNEVLMEAMEQAPGGFVHWHRPILPSATMVEETELLEVNVMELEQTISFLEEEVQMLRTNNRSSPQRKEPTPGSRTVDDGSTFVVSPINIGSSAQCEGVEVADVIHPSELQRSNLYTRLKEKPRNRKVR